MRARLRRYFITGLIVVLPLAVTLNVLLWALRVLDGLLGQFFVPLIGTRIPLLGLLTLLVVILVSGMLATNMLGRRVVELVDRLMLRIPLARSVYSAVKQLTDSLFLQRRSAFQRVVLIEWPRRGIYTVGFVTGESVGEPQERTPERVLNVFVVTTPNPTTGFLVLVPEDQVIPLEMSVEDALKMVMSGGIVTPSHPLTVAGPTAARRP
ncbi:MAG: DUF502 domain-containing protein [Armatimonadota bacterium]|nr:DUF502 domain-containing protein [Armatimonadota bacterium]MDR7402051.1 DUF502 domain-containing protein [Armatimonadota bacterium]MDR7403984.1 DUF502 domain-containing protein [Armatimonadota bacterium]MDR7437123.1 DUF502 domain-containing protein [Armatimonadota bacterium]MDR7472468.1 DUF502 domain-containing protein [Armatimonadota bacterium]